MPNISVNRTHTIPASPTQCSEGFRAAALEPSVPGVLSSRKKCIIKKTGIRQLANVVHSETLSTIFLVAKEELVMLQIRDDNKINPMISMYAPAAFNQRLFSALRNIRLAAYAMPAPME